MLAAEVEFRKRLFVDGTAQLARTWDKFPASPEMKNATFAVGISVFNRDIRVKSGPWMACRFGWSVVLDHPEFGEMRVSSTNTETPPLTFFPEKAQE